MLGVTSIADLFFKMEKDKRYEYLLIEAYANYMGRSALHTTDRLRRAKKWLDNWVRDMELNGKSNCAGMAKFLNERLNKVEIKYPNVLTTSIEEISAEDQPVQSSTSAPF